MKGRKRKIFFLTSIILFLLGLFILHFYVPRIIVEIKSPLLGIFKNNSLTVQTSGYKNCTLKGREIVFKSFDGTVLSSFITYSNLDTVKGTIILLHGIRSSKEYFIKMSEELSVLGYNSVALDLRAHGSSGGTFCTFGVKEKQDVSVLIDVLKKDKNIKTNIGIWGQSLGGAIGLQAMAVDKRIKFGIIESTFSDFTTITNVYFNYHIGFNIEVFTNYLVCRAGKIADFNPDEAKPSNSCKKITQPILLVHGNKDKRINIKYAKENFRNLKSVNKKFIEIEGANHINVWKKGGSKYFDEVISFLENSCNYK